MKPIVEIDKPGKTSVYTPYPHAKFICGLSDPCVYAVSEREKQILNESGESVEYVYSESLGDYVMVPSSVNRRKFTPSYEGEFVHSVTPLAFTSHSCCSQSLVSSGPVSCTIPTTTHTITSVSNPSPELVSILKRVPSSS